MIKLFGKPVRVNKASAHQKNLDVGANIFIGNYLKLVRLYRISDCSVLQEIWTLKLMRSCCMTLSLRLVLF